MNTTARLSLLAALLAGAGMVSTSAMAATAVGTANATVLTPIAITAGTALDFGTFAALTGGSVIIAAAGGRSATGTVFLSPGNAGSPASFNVTGDGALTFAVTYPGSFNVTHTNTINTMAVTVTGAATGALVAGAATLPVGGTLTVASGQLAGSYSGTYTMTVEYN